MAALDLLVDAAILQLLVTPEPAAWPARQLVALVREIQDALLDDLRDGTTDGLQRLWLLHHDEERTERP